MTQILFSVVLMIAVILMMLLAGLSTGVQDLQIQWHKPGRSGMMTRLVLLNAVLIPVITITTLAAVEIDESLAFVLMILALSPVAPFVPALVLLARGDAPFSVSLLVLLSAASIVTIPLGVGLIGVWMPGLIHPQGLTVKPFLLEYALPVFTPLAIGIIVRTRHPASAKQWIPRLKPAVAVFNLLLVFLALVLHHRALSEISSSQLALLSAFLLFCLATGAVALYPYREPGLLSAATLSSGFRNIAIALLLTQMLYTQALAIVLIVTFALLALCLCLGLAVTAAKFSSPRTNPGSPL